MKKLDGLLPAIVIPYKENYEVDEEVLRKYVEWISKFEIKGLVINSDAGEGHFLTHEERKRNIKIIKEIIGDKIPLISGLGGQTTKDVIESGKEFKDLGVNYFLVFPHPAFKGGPAKDNLIIKYHEEISKIGIGMIIFQLQEALGGTFYHFETLKELVEIENVVAIKEATFDALKFKETVDFLNTLSKKIEILTGNDNFIPESFLLGADGALIGFGSIFTDIQVDVIKKIKEKKFDEGLNLFRKIEKICVYCFKRPVRDYRARIKEFLVCMGIFKNSLVRSPLLPLSKEEKEEIRKLYEEFKNG
ncbi:MAG TPA: dihydrodipicolinate synthase family protein [bacterium]|nr:dihydrodipicolinate synthase family protein [bacterium]HOM27493.1 dihydrodipicolinate synthase family protein [bacterium]